MSIWRIGAAVVLTAALMPPVAHARAVESKRMEHAKDLIADEQWVRAIDELKATAADPKETNKDEALFWLAHSLNQTHDASGAIETIRRLEREYPASRWVKPARSLRIEIAQRLQRSDVLWYLAAPPPVPAVAATPPMGPFLAPAPATPVPPAAPPVPVPASTTTPRPPAAPKALPAMPPPKAVPPTPAAPLPPTVWIPEGFFPDMDQRIMALASLLRTDAPKVIPILKSIALESSDTGEGRRALLVLAQSSRPEARATVIDVAKTGPERVRLVAVRELGRIGGPTIVDDLMQVYATATEGVKYQVVTALAQRDAAPALMKIAQSEADRRVRDFSIVTLGEAGGREQLTMMYAKAATDAKRPIIVGLFNAQAEDELIQIAEREKDPAVREEALSQLRLLGTPKARAYLAKHR
ncbi:MAG TPA: HEAT repeat domain-containing protein [Vicinamibacterales bacterium]|jgi:HEAT repeat protein|nr:HEAT repeat domain-containing protein [Vicinamibacterales bacterium]